MVFALLIFLVLGVSPSPDSFDYDYSLLELAVKLYEEGEFESSELILRTLISDDSQNLKAKGVLAKLLYIRGYSDEAGRLCSEVLKLDPDNPEALWVKGNLFYLNGDYFKSIKTFDKILKQGDYFDAQFSKSQILLELNDVRGAYKIFSKMVPSEPLHLENYYILESILSHSKKLGFALSGDYSMYSDEIGISSNRFNLRADFYLSNVKMQTDYTNMLINDTATQYICNIISFNFLYRLNAFIGIKLNNGIVMLPDENRYFGGGTGDILIPGGTLKLSFSHDVLFENSELIANIINVNRFRAGLYQKLSSVFDLNSMIEYRIYSDDNDALELSVSPIYYFYREPNSISGIEYRFKFMEYQRETSHGYFDPSKFVSHRIKLLHDMKKGRLFYIAEPYLGFEFYTRSGYYYSGVSYGGYFSVGYKISYNLLAELNLDLGNSEGYKYYQFGIRIGYR